MKESNNDMVFLNEQYNVSSGSLKKISAWGILFFVFSMLTMFIFSAFTASYWINRSLIFVALLCILLKGKIGWNHKVLISYTDILFFIVSIAFLISCMRTSRFEDLFFFILCVLFLFFAKTVDIHNYLPTFKLIKFAGIFFSLGNILQIFFLDKYYQLYFPLFSFDFQTSISRQLRHGMYMGFTSQTVVTAVYLIMALGLTYSFWQSEKFTWRKTVYILIITISLLLTGKRGPVLFMCVAFVCTGYMFEQKGRKVIKILKYVMITLVLFVFLYFLVLPFLGDTGNSLSRLFGTLFGNDDVDISNGRFVLYELAWKLFKSNPFLGIGWGNFNKMAAVLLNFDGHAHNMYLQLLCETGIIGFTVFITALASVLIMSIKLIAKLNKGEFKTQKYLKASLKFSFFIQTFFIFYSMTGNPLYDYNFIMLYFFGSAIAFAVQYKIKNLELQNTKLRGGSH